MWLANAGVKSVSGSVDGFLIASKDVVPHLCWCAGTVMHLLSGRRVGVCLCRWVAASYKAQ